MLISRIGTQIEEIQTGGSVGALCGFDAISGLHPTAHET